MVYEYCIVGLYDRCAGRYINIYCAETVEVAARDFTNEVRRAQSNSRSLFASNPRDFHIDCLGRIDGDSGDVEPENLPQLIISGAMVMAQYEQEMEIENEQ